MNIQITNVSDHALVEFFTLVWGLFFVVIALLGVVAYMIYLIIDNLIDKIGEVDDDDDDYEQEMRRPVFPTYFRSEETITTTKTKPTEGEKSPKEEGSDDN